MTTFLRLLLVIGGLLAAGCEAQDRSFTRAQVLDSDFEVIQVISDLETLGELNKIWYRRSTVDPATECHFSHKIDLTTGEFSLRWLYDPSGYVTILSKVKKPIYKFDNPDQLKKILIPQQNNIGS